MTGDIHSLLGKYFNGEATAEEEQLVQQWVEADEQNRADFKLLQKLWNQSAEPEQLNFDTENAWQKVDTTIKTSKKPGRVIQLRVRAIAVAASLVVLLGLFWLVRDMFGNRTVIADIEVKEVQLHDGSKVYLRKGARLEFPRKFDNDSREVSLKGEAFFEVTPNPDQPFIITAANTTVEVVGTSFSVSTQNDSVELIVKTGRVNFAGTNKSQAILVSAGERALFANNNLTRQPNQDENFNAWQSKQLVFNNTPLSEVAAVLSDYYNVTITIKKEDAAQLSSAGLTTRFNNQSLQAVLNEISLITSYRIEKTGDANYEISIK